MPHPRASPALAGKQHPRGIAYWPSGPHAGWLAFRPNATLAALRAERAGYGKMPGLPRGY